MWVELVLYRGRCYNECRHDEDMHNSNSDCFEDLNDFKNEKLVTRLDDATFESQTSTFIVYVSHTDCPPRVFRLRTTVPFPKRFVFTYSFVTFNVKHPFIKKKDKYMLSNMFKQHLLSKKKMVLLVDLDKTIVHSQSTSGFCRNYASVILVC